MALERGRNRYRASSNYWGAIILDWFKFLQNPLLNGADYKILFLICELMDDRSNNSLIRQKDIATKLNMDKSNVSKSIKKLIELQFIMKVPNGFMVNPHLFYVGRQNQIDREMLMVTFDELVIDKTKAKPVFYLNTEDRKLEVSNRK